MTINYKIRISKLLNFKEKEIGWYSILRRVKIEYLFDLSKNFYEKQTGATLPSFFERSIL